MARNKITPPQPPLIEQSWIDAVMTHARDHYETDGWDMVVECMSADDIKEELSEGFLDGRKVTSADDAIACIGERAKLYDDHRRDIRGTAF